MDMNMSREAGFGSAGQKITPFLWFDRNAEEAMNYYVSIFNGNPAKKSESKVVSIKRYPSDMQVGPLPDMAGKVLTGVFELEGQQFMCLDGGPFFKPPGAISFLVECQDQTEIDHFWEKLGAGGDPKLQQCGWLGDKYGFAWQIVPNMEPWLNNPDKEKVKRAMAAMLEMKKIVIKDLENA